jgi:hypothetical protein
MKRKSWIATGLLALASGLPLSAAADAVLDWNEIGMGRVAAARQSPADGTRSLAMMHVAMFDAVNAIEPRYRSYAYEGKAPGASADAAAATAAHDVLASLFPADKELLAAAYQASMARVPGGNARDAGVALGHDVAARCVAMRTGDGAGAASRYKPKVTRGVYVPTAYPVSSEFAVVKPFVMTDPAQFRPGPPPDLDGDTWKRDLEEIRAVGGRASKTRTAEQTDVARFWSLVGPPSYNPIVRSLALSRPMSLVDNARVFALVYAATTDAYIAVFDAKYAYDFWRPITAVRFETDEAQWMPFIDTPMHPEYPCAHCITSAAAATVLEGLFGKGPVSIDMTSANAPGVTRHWTRIADYPAEVSEARVWSGVHYRNSARVGADMGRRIGELALARVMQPLGAAPNQASR